MSHTRTTTMNGEQIAGLLTIIDSCLEQGLLHIVSCGHPVPVPEFEFLVELRSAFLSHFNVVSPEPEAIGAYRHLCKEMEEITTARKTKHDAGPTLLRVPGKREIH